MLQLQAADQAAGGGNYSFLLILVLLFGFMYFVMIRPQQKRRKEALQMQNTLGPGDEIVTIGGLHGTVVLAETDTVTLEVAPGVHVRFARPAIARVLTKAGTVSEEPAPVGEPLADEPESPVTETRKQD
ncbi:putative preprotein translocase YajC subunit [Actinoplanes missouriensis 431]|uniref:Putative preprotein translocase YajC subunit n=1 Tax=Actinoplanes missouriensis (strain ATCC 14538 / DSM 43046 / CBS 188.64 / JCM 3121 / NBRC 102363 / NCIMB 12654 / NRRL B-3342 / UNCC 431) TaxID=512565 RepID=I0HER2_ACTM4|nr:preprotein translocase subunit YajC [Actinoplanes missouriensis]BAL91499.1 putative preprotein translocase YajC subunit [Actinoplanes missouriensis 431]